MIDMELDEHCSLLSSGFWQLDIKKILFREFYENIKHKLYKWEAGGKNRILKSEGDISLLSW